MKQTRQGLSKKSLPLLACAFLFMAVLALPIGLFFLTIAAGLTSDVVRMANIEVGWEFIGGGVLSLVIFLFIMSLWLKKRRIGHNSVTTNRPAL